MDQDIHRYAGEDIEVSYDVNRCIHVRECVRGLPGVFDPDRRPWVDADAADADELASVIMDCPTGALQFERADGGPAEPTPEENVVTVTPDGPLYLRGDIELTTPEGDTLLTDTRVALCRCGASKNKPLCDNAHEESDFESDGTVGGGESVTEKSAPTDTLSVTPMPDGPVMLDGEFEIRGADGERVRGTETAICRCGASGTRPFCDGTHREIDFSTE